MKEIWRKMKCCRFTLVKLSSIGEAVMNGEYSVTASWGPTPSGQNCNYFMFLLSPNSQKRLAYKENSTNNRSLTWKPRSHVSDISNVAYWEFSTYQNSAWSWGPGDTKKENWMTMFIHVFSLCPLGVTIKPNFNLRKVAYCNKIATLTMLRCWWKGRVRGETTGKGAAVHH